MRATPRIHRSQIAALFAVPALVLMLAGCAAGGSSAESTAAAGDAPLSDEEYSKAWDSFNLEVAQCLRDKGFDVKDPAPGAGFEENLPGMNEAGTACYDELGGPPSSGVKLTDAEILDSMMKTVDCLRKKGYDVPDPTLETGVQGVESVSQADLDICYS